MSDTAKMSSSTGRAAGVVSTVKTAIARAPVVGAPAVQLSRWVRRVAYPGSAEFWEKTYARGRTSGSGSYGRLAEFKAEVLNGFVAEHQVQSVIEFGCGDGNQLSLMKYPSYIGLDVSKAAIKRCKDRFAEDATKSFFLYDSDCFVDNHSLFSADVALSLDVIFHLTEDAVYERYMTHVFNASRRLVVIYSSDQQDAGRRDRVACVRHRKFSSWIASNRPQWELIGQVENPVKFPVCRDGSFSDFYFYKRTERAEPAPG